MVLVFSNGTMQVISPPKKVSEMPYDVKPTVNPTSLPETDLEEVIATTTDGAHAVNLEVEETTAAELAQSDLEETNFDETTIASRLVLQSAHIDNQAPLPTSGQSTSNFSYLYIFIYSLGVCTLLSFATVAFSFFLKKSRKKSEEQNLEMGQFKHE